MKSIYLALILSSVLAVPGQAKKVSTKLNAPTTSLQTKNDRHKIRGAEHIAQDKIAGKLTFMAYDKKTGSSKETFFIDNGSDTSLSGLELEISYYNSSGKMIHKRKVDISQYLPAKETRKVDISSWDTQKSYHYINSVPSAKGSTVYTVRFKVISLTVCNQ